MTCEAAQQAKLPGESAITLRRRLPYFGLLLILSIAFAYNSPILLQDLPDWVLQGQQLAARWMGGVSQPELHLKSFPVPNSMFTVMIALLGSVIGFQAAAKAIVIACLWVLGWIVLRLAQRL